AQVSALVLRLDGSVQTAISESDGDEEEGADQGQHGSLSADCQDQYGQDECGNGQAEVEVPPELMELLLDDAGNLFGSGHRRTRCTVAAASRTDRETAMSRRQWPRATSPGAMNPSTRSTPRLIRASWSVASLMASIALSGMPLEARSPDTLRSSTAMAVTIVMIAAISTPIAKPPSVRVRTLPTSPMKPVRYSYQCGRALASSPSFSSPPSRIRPSYRAVDAAGGDGSSPER